ncbi:MAG TPA: hypothetical protein VM097_06875, partial [Mycobacteriales bacterium]|nr:hypothetical protein [Mycobacteriales bacterium]
MKAKHLRTTPTRRRVSRAVTIPVVTLAALSLAAPAMAARPSGGSSSGSSLSVVVKTGPDQTPNFGETITFDVTSPVYKKWVDLYCYQGGATVYSQTAGFYPEYPWAPDYGLSSAYWTSGAADCKATLYTTNSKGRQTVLATLS